MHPLLDPSPPALSGMTVQVAETLAPQLLVENRGAQTLEILDDHGRAFIRIGPKGVEADLAAAAWYETYSTAAMPVPEGARDPAAPPRWGLVQHEPAWGWFDPRLNVAKTHVSHADSHADHPVLVGAWTVPVLVDGAPSRIEGHFQFRPQPRGGYEASLIKPADFPADVDLRVIQGNTPGIFVEDNGKRIVTVVGLSGDPYIRLGPEGAEVNTASLTWRTYGRERSGENAAPAPGEAPRWLRVSPAHNYTWLETRATLPTSALDGPAHPDFHWSIPLVIDGRSDVLEGVSRWTPN